MRPDGVQIVVNRRAEGGFTLVELAVVLVIIGVIMSILVPSLAAARASARKVQSLAVMNNLSSAASQFITDRRTVPGYFSPAEMGDVANGDFASTNPAGGGRGFSSMQNVMLDLAGGIAGDQSLAADGTSILEVGPRPDRTVKVDVAQIGALPKTGGAAASKAYFIPDRTYFVAQQTVDRQAGTVDDHRAMPTVVDAFGFPILAWAADDRVATITRTNANDLNFAAPASDPTGASLRRFYWAQNYAALNASSLGGKGRNQQFGSGAGRGFSMIGGGTGQSVPIISASLAALLGNPALPLRDGLESATIGPAPSASRGALIFHSAGPNGFYMGSEERGGIKARRTRTGDPGPANSVDFVTNGNDAMDDFDDQVVAIGG